MESIKAGYNSSGSVDLKEVNDVHAAASALKALLRELPQPILAETVLFRLQRLLKQQQQATPKDSDPSNLSSVCIAVLEMLQKALSPVMLHTLTMLCELCSQLSGSRKVTKWSVDGLATAIGPALYRDGHITNHGELQAFMVAGNKAVAFLFENYRTLFKPARNTPEIPRKRVNPPSPEDKASSANPVAKPPRKSGTKPASGTRATVGSAYSDADREKAGSAGSPLAAQSSSTPGSTTGSSANAGGKGKKPLSAGHSLLADVLASQRVHAAAAAAAGAESSPKVSPGRGSSSSGGGGGSDREHATPPGSASASYDGLDFPDAMRDATTSPGGTWNAASGSVSPFSAQRGGRRVQAAAAHAVARVLFGEWGDDGLPAVVTMSAAAEANDGALAAAWVASPMAGRNPL